MKHVKVKGCGKFNKIVEDEIDKLLKKNVEQAYKEGFLRRGVVSRQNPDELAFAE